MNTQPEALRLAELLDTTYVVSAVTNNRCQQAAAELRRLHAETTNQQDWLVEWRKCEAETKRLHALNQELLEALKALVQVTAHLDPCPATVEQARAAIIKATGENT